MKELAIVFLFSIFSFQITGQQINKYLDIQFMQITNPPHCVKVYQDTLIIEITKIDSAYNKILRFKNKAIPYLISKLPDTTRTNIYSQLFKKNLKQGDLALILINDIEWIPFSSITKIQWCICCDCFNFPVDFFEYLDKHRTKFYLVYKRYFYSKIQKQKLLKKVH